MGSEMCIRDRFYDLMKKQCLLKGIASAEDWDQIRDDILFVYETDTHFDELKNAELMEQRLNLVGQAIDHRGRYFSDQEIRHNILRQNDTDIDRINQEIEEEKEAGLYDDGDDGGF